MSIEGLKGVINTNIASLSYLEDIDDQMIFDSYKEAVPFAISEHDPSRYLPETNQHLNRFYAMIITELL
jgi:hypothetical protein